MLRWDFREKAGTITQVDGGKEWTFNFYIGNAMMIVLYEYEEDGAQKYQLQWFFSDEQHAKICLGLAKNAQGEKRNIFSAGSITHMAIYRDHCRDWAKIVKFFGEAFPHIAFDVYSTEPKA